MTSNTLVLLEFLLIAGLVLGFAVYQLHSVRRRDKPERPPDPDDRPEDGPG